MDAIQVQTIGGPYKPIKTYSKKRRCSQCKAFLSVYNKSEICSPCRRK